MPLRLLLLTALLSISAVVSSEADVRYQAITALGELNGIALQCKYLDQVRRMKTAVVASAPKERSFGLAFDQATNKAFLAFIENQDRCPAPGGFEQQVGERIEVVREAFVVD